MSSRAWVCVYIIIIVSRILLTKADTDSRDTTALNIIKSMWQGVPSTWNGYDPCGSNWDGITCTGNRVTIIHLASMNIEGSLSGDIKELTELQVLDLSYNTGLSGTLPSAIGQLSKLTTLVLSGCGFYGSIPSTIGSLTELTFMSLISNKLSGEIPASIGNLKSLKFLDLANNQLTGIIPVSSGKTTPGLDWLFEANHFHFGNNKLSGSIPPELFSSNMSLLHLLLENNDLTGDVPDTLGLVNNLEVVRLDGNNLSGNLPSNLNNLGNVSQMYLSNNLFTGALPNLTGMNLLTYVDMSNNSFDASDLPSWFSAFPALTTLILEKTNIQGPLPIELFSLPQLETVNLKRNNLDGTFDVGSSYSTQLQLVDLQQNDITSVALRRDQKFDLILINNPVCEAISNSNASYCKVSQPPRISYSTPPKNCSPPFCRLGQISSPMCTCAYPYTGTLVLRAPSFSNLGNTTHFTDLELSLMNFFLSRRLPVDSVSLSYTREEGASSLEMKLQMFPFSEIQFNRTGISTIGFTLSNQTFHPPDQYGPYYFIADPYTAFSDGKKGLSTGAIVGIAVGVSVVFLLLLIAVVLFFRKGMNKSAKQDQVAEHVSGRRMSIVSSSNSILQVSGARCFALEELKRCTNNFSNANGIGSGGYGKVYKGALSNRQPVAIKRADPQSTHGELEFKTEIELLSRVHHKNLVSLLGFCYEKGELLLVYEFAQNGNLRQSLSGKSGVRLNWMRRIEVTLGAARGLQYLHEHANPPIIHRDVKSTNILLDETLNAKVSDFGLSKPLMDSEKDHITTQVKGTLGYLDPEYYTSQRLTEKSDVYSFGVIILEIITGKAPIERGRHIVREVKNVLDKSQDLYNLHELLDPAIYLGTTMGGFERFVDLGMRCVEESGSRRPAMADVVKELESIAETAGTNPIFDSSATTSGPLLDSGRIDSPFIPY